MEYCHRTRLITQQDTSQTEKDTEVMDVVYPGQSTAHKQSKDEEWNTATELV